MRYIFWILKFTNVSSSLIGADLLSSLIGADVSSSLIGADVSKSLIGANVLSSLIGADFQTPWLGPGLWKDKGSSSRNFRRNLSFLQGWKGKVFNSINKISICKANRDLPGSVLRFWIHNIVSSDIWKYLIFCFCINVFGNILGSLRFGSRSEWARIFLLDWIQNYCTYIFISSSV